MYYSVLQYYGVLQCITVYYSVLHTLWLTDKSYSSIFSPYFPVFWLIGVKNLLTDKSFLKIDCFTQQASDQKAKDAFNLSEILTHNVCVKS